MSYIPIGVAYVSFCQASINGAEPEQKHAEMQPRDERLGNEHISAQLPLKERTPRCTAVITRFSDSCEEVSRGTAPAPSPTRPLAPLTASGLNGERSRRAAGRFTVLLTDI